MINFLTAAIVPEEAYNAPFVGFGMNDKRRLTRIGVIGEDGSPDEAVINTLAIAFTVDFMKNCIDTYGDEDEAEIFFIYDTLLDLLKKGEVLAAYLYLVLRGGANDVCSVRNEVVLMARRDDLLRLFMDCFIVTFGEFMDAFEDVLDENK